MEPTETELVDALMRVHAAIERPQRMAWGVVRDGTLAHANGVEATADTVFRIASMTKSFTATAVLLLRDAGLLALDTPVRAYAPELAALASPWRDAPPVTLRHLLTMSSGLATDDPWADRHMDIAPADLDAVIAGGCTWSTPPGVGFEYSNLGYGLIGRVVERVTGERLQAIVTEKVLAPLGMTSTGFTREALPADHDLAMGLRRAPDADVAEPLQADGGIAPMGGLFTTVADLARWVAWMLDAWPPRDDEEEASPLSRASRRELQRVWTVIPPETHTTGDGRAVPTAIGYGMGLSLVAHPTLGFLVGHGGGLPGYGSHMRWAPDCGVGVVALANITYATMADGTTAMLDALAARGAIAKRAARVAPALDTAARALVALLDDWDDARADDLFTDNVAPDEPYTRRAEQAAKLVADHGGPFSVESITPEGAAFAIVRVRGANSSFTVEFQLGPLVPPRIQWYEVT